MMPKGVEHALDASGAVMEDREKITMMPKGVEHPISLIGAPLQGGEDNYDAERR